MSDDNQDFIRSLEKATLSIIQSTAKNMERACLVIERDAKKNCNVDQGHLRASITHDVDFNAQRITGSIFSNLDYAPYLESGTGIYAKDGNGRKTPWNWGNKGSKKWPGRRGWEGSRPHPFLEPARESNKSKVAEMLAGKSK